MTAIEDPRHTEFWQRELAELAEHHGASSENAARGPQARYLACFVRTGAPVVACAEAGTSKYKLNKWVREDPVFFEARSLAIEAYSDLLVAEMTRRAVDGELITVKDRHGQIVGEERKFSDDLLKFALKGLDAHARWAQRAETQANREGAWRADLAKILADPEKRKALEELSDLMGGRKD